MEVLKSKLKHVKVLREDRQQKMVTLSGEDEEGNVAILVYNRKAFPVGQQGIINRLVSSEVVLKQNCDHENDIWHTYQVLLDDEAINQTKLTVIYPATEKLIKKYTAQKMYLIEETATMYNNITKPYLDKHQHSLSWVYNILDGKSEQDRVIVNDTDEKKGFMLLPSMNWPGDIEDLYLITLPHRRDLGSIRDLRSEHIPVLEYMEKKAVEACQDKYGLGKAQLRMFFHYQPSFYHLHLHIMNVGYRPTGTEVGRAVLLRDVIDNLRLSDTYYADKTMTYCLPEEDELRKLFMDVTNISAEKA